MRNILLKRKAQWSLGLATIGTVVVMSAADVTPCYEAVQGPMGCAAVGNLLMAMMAANGFCPVGPSVIDIRIWDAVSPTQDVGHTNPPLITEIICSYQKGKPNGQGGCDAVVPAEDAFIDTDHLPVEPEPNCPNGGGGSGS